MRIKRSLQTYQRFDNGPADDDARKDRIELSSDDKKLSVRLDKRSFTEHLSSSDGSASIRHYEVPHLLNPFGKYKGFEIASQPNGEVKGSELANQSSLLLPDLYYLTDLDPAVALAHFKAESARFQK
jgi:hypothetical protein